jgi:hypothetical protein
MPFSLNPKTRGISLFESLGGLHKEMLPKASAQASGARFIMNINMELPWKIHWASSSHAPNDQIRERFAQS